MQAFVLFEWKEVGTGAALLADDQVAECRPLSGRGEGVKTQKNRVLKLNPSSHYDQNRVERRSHTFQQFSGCKVCNWWMKKILQRCNWAQRRLHCGEPTYLTSPPLESLCPWKQEPEKSAVQGAFSYPSFPLLLTLIGCQQHLTVASWGLPLGRSLAQSRENQMSGRFCQLPQPRRQGAGLFAFGVIR